MSLALCHCAPDVDRDGKAVSRVTFENPIEQHLWLKNESLLPDTIPHSSFCNINSKMQVEAMAEISFIQYVKRGTEADQMEAYWNDWSWINFPDSSASCWLLFEFGVEGKMLPFLLDTDEGFFPGAVSGWAGLWQEGDWLCVSEINHYSTQDIELTNETGSSDVLLEFLYRDFQRQFWGVMQDSFKHKLMLSKSFRAG